MLKIYRTCGKKLVGELINAIVMLIAGTIDTILQENLTF